jgi:hypothetical protein
VEVGVGKGSTSRMSLRSPAKASMGVRTTPAFKVEETTTSSCSSTATW